MSAKDHTNSETALYIVEEETPTSEPSIRECIETTTGVLLPKEYKIRSG